jgi:ubiquinone/menaquinone biosynthesis C-methylase UbiE
MSHSSNIAYRASKNKMYFDEWSKSYDAGRISRWFQYTQGMVIRMLALQPGSKVLDVGCGTGHAVLYLASMLSDGKACGIDISAGMIRAAQAKVPEALRGQVEFRQADAIAIPYPEGYFDHVICTNSFHHYADPLQALKEMRRVLSPHGELVILENAPDLSWYTWTWDRILRIFEKGMCSIIPPTSSVP